MRSLRQIRESISHARVEAKSEADQAVLRHLLAELAAVAEGETLSATDLLTVACLNAAFRRGGWEAVEQQCEMAARRLDFRPQRVTVEELIEEWIA